jgi:hypothetical protein
VDLAADLVDATTDPGDDTGHPSRRFVADRFEGIGGARTERPRRRRNAFFHLGATSVLDRDRGLQLVVALLAIVALAVAAATLDSTVMPEDGSGSGGEDGGGPGSGTTEHTTTPDPVDENSPYIDASADCLPFLREPPALLAGLLLFVGLFVATYRWTNSRVAGVAICGAVGLPVGLVWGVLAVCSPESAGRVVTSTATPGGAATNGTGGGAGGSEGLGGGAEALSSPTLLVALFVLVALLVVVVALLSLGTDRGGAAGEAPDAEPPEEDPAAVGRVAGSAADRIDAADVDADNEVYRAWTRMTTALDVDSPATTTPREFQRAAVEAGMDRRDVAALTELFESVRYGGLDPTDEQERAAVETLRRIEAGDGGD